MTEISRTDISLFRDRLLMFSTLILSNERAEVLFHQASQFVSMRNALETIAEGGRSNADLSVLARKILEAERADRTKVKRRSKPLVRLEGAP